MSAIVTPCVQVCFIDEASGLCLGCLRSLSEIADWATLTACERETILASLPRRRRRVEDRREDSSDAKTTGPD